MWFLPLEFTVQQGDYTLNISLHYNHDINSMKPLTHWLFHLNCFKLFACLPQREEMSSQPYGSFRVHLQPFFQGKSTGPEGFPSFYKLTLKIISVPLVLFSVPVSQDKPCLFQWKSAFSYTYILRQGCGMVLQWCCVISIIYIFFILLYNHTSLNKFSSISEFVYFNKFKNLSFMGTSKSYTQK